jgi:alpha-glucosidase (family GH31 glycosyl hydrolase)
MYVEPWFLGEKLYAVFKDYANLRYKLIPYIYSMAHIASEKAIPVMRALSLIYPDDIKCDNYMNQYMFGDAFLVSAFQKTVYLPEGEWIDYWTGEKWQGKKEIPAKYPENKGGPLFVKAGSIIPTQQVTSYIGNKTPEGIIWEIFPKGQSKFTLYEDDGESYNYLKGEVAKTVLECSENEKEIVITVNPRSGSYSNMPEKRTHSFKVFYKGKLKLKNKHIPCHFDESNNILSIEAIPESSQKIELVLKK